MDKPGLVDWLIAPLTWLERARGPKRLGLLALSMTTLLVVGMLGWRWFSLWGLPDIGEPFDEAAYGTVDVPDAANAMVLYRKAAEKLDQSRSSRYQVSSPKAWDNLDWPTADPEVRRWLLDNGEPLAIWLEATKRPDSLFVQPKELSKREFLDAQGSLRSFSPLIGVQTFSGLARLEASRLGSSGNLEGAWNYYRAVLRSSRHVGMHGLVVQRSLGRDILVKVLPDVIRWSEDPRVTPGMLRRAITDVEACRAMTPRNSEMFRANYFVTRSNIEVIAGSSGHRLGTFDGEPTWSDRLAVARMIRGFLNNEPERSHRVHRLVVAGILAQCDRPGGERPKLVSPKHLIFDRDDRTPATVASISPESLATWADRSDYKWNSGNVGFVFSRIEAEASTFDTMLLKLAERAFEIEHGQPPKTYGDLLGGYLKALPQGFEPGDAVAPSVGAN